MSAPTNEPEVYLNAAWQTHYEAWPTGDIISLQKVHETIGRILMYLRALDSASSQSPSHQDGAAPSRVSELIEIGGLLDRSLREALPADDGWMLVYEARDRVKALIDAEGES